MELPFCEPHPKTGGTQLFVPMECHPASPLQLRCPLRLTLITQAPVRRLVLSGAESKDYALLIFGHVIIV